MVQNCKQHSRKGLLTSWRRAEKSSFDWKALSFEVLSVLFRHCWHWSKVVQTAAYVAWRWLPNNRLLMRKSVISFKLSLLLFYVFDPRHATELHVALWHQFIRETAAPLLNCGKRHHKMMAHSVAHRKSGKPLPSPNFENGSHPSLVARPAARLHLPSISIAWTTFSGPV